MKSEKNSNQTVTKTQRGQELLEREKHQEQARQRQKQRKEHGSLHQMQRVLAPCCIFIPNITTRIILLAHAMEMYI